jgi:hypothetical protein
MNSLVHSTIRSHRKTIRSMAETTRKSSRKRKSPIFFGNDDDEDKEEGLARKVKNSKKSVDLASLSIADEVVPLPTRNAKGELVFKDHTDFRPNLTPEEVIRLGLFLFFSYLLFHPPLFAGINIDIYAGSFGGTYFRPITSSVSHKSYTVEEALHDLPPAWFEGLNIKRMVASAT